jgi:hypothetical protein
MRGRWRRRSTLRSVSGGWVTIVGAASFALGLVASSLYRRRDPNTARRAGISDRGLYRFGARTLVLVTTFLLVAGVGLLIMARALVGEDEVVVSSLPPRDAVMSGGLPSLVVVTFAAVALFGAGAFAGETYAWLSSRTASTSPEA